MQLNGVNLKANLFIRIISCVINTKKYNDLLPNLFINFMQLNGFNLKANSFDFFVL